jgi:predicted metal-dependent HD superfamily phosphohydrolase
MSGSRDHQLSTRWAVLTGSFLGSASLGPADAVGADLVARYSEPHRHYHTGEHLAEVLDVVDELVPFADDPVAVALAAWFHDAVYDPRSSTNEHDSAVLARTVLDGLGLDAERVAEVARLVELTASHAVSSADADGAVVMDADLSILASSPERYERYAADVRAEYGHLDDRTFAAGRAEVLASLLGRDRWFHTPPMVDREPIARANVSAELAGLRSHLSGSS